MGDTKEPNVGTIPCLVCGSQFTYLTTSHMRTHDPEQPQTIPQYREWVADRFNLDHDDPAVTGNDLLKPQLWRANREKFDSWRERTK